MAKNKKNVSVNESVDVENVSVEKKSKSKGVEKKPNFFSRTWKKLCKFFKDIRSEMKKVVWTSKDEVKKSTKLVVVTVVAVAVAIALVDTFCAWVIGSFAGLIG